MKQDGLRYYVWAKVRGECLCCGKRKCCFSIQVRDPEKVQYYVCHPCVVNLLRKEAEATTDCVDTTTEDHVEATINVPSEAIQQYEELSSNYQKEIANLVEEHTNDAEPERILSSLLDGDEGEVPDTAQGDEDRKSVV